MNATASKLALGTACGSPEPPEGNYFVSAYPPFSCWNEPRVEAVEGMLRTAADTTAAPLGLYVHIPFCIKRCDYCYYLSYADKTGDQIDRYLAGLVRELELYSQAPALARRGISFVYFGGGTPSLLSAKRIECLIDGLKQSLPWRDVQEFTFECAPNTVSEKKLQVLKEAGVTRVSLGVQQLDDDVLSKNGRVHLVRDVERAYAEVCRVGFDLVNVDLMVGMVGETDQSLRHTVDQVVQMEPQSVTIYQLEVPGNTPLYRNLSSGSCEQLASWDEKRSRLAWTFGRLEEAGYTVRSAYAAVRDVRRHRFVYQDAQYHGADMLGLGVAAFSYFRGLHYQNSPSFGTYLDRLEKGRLPLARAYELREAERLVRELILQLKLGGVSSAYFRRKFGVEIVERFVEVLERFAARGWLTFDTAGVRLTRSGLLRVDRLLPAFYLAEHQAARYW